MPDADGNRIQGEAMLHNIRNCIIQAAGRLVGAVGVNNLIIIDASDALLVSDKTYAQDVKHILPISKHEVARPTNCTLTVHRPLGAYIILEEGLGFKIKRIEFKLGASLSL